jgi:hypothetical protein
VERVSNLIPDAELVVLPKAAHAIGPRTAARLTALLVPFLAEGEEEVAENEEALAEQGA